MSIIVYGPTGCGKTRFAEQLRQRLGCLNVIDDATWPKTTREWSALKRGNDLLLVTADPSDPLPQPAGADSRVLSFQTLADEFNLPTSSAACIEHPLYPIFIAALEQAMHGKGERHGGNTTPFLEQPWAHYAKMHGRGFLTGQAAKKLEEAAHQRSGEAFREEILGAIIYAAMSVLLEEED